MSQQGLAQNEQKCQFWAKNPNFFKRNQKFCFPHHGKPTSRHLVHIGRHGTKWAKNANVWPKMTKNAYFGPNLAVFGPKILIFMGISKCFGTHIMEKPPRQLVCIVFWSGIRTNWPKMPIFGRKCQFWAKFGHFGQKILFFTGEIKSFVTHITENPPRHLVHIGFWSGIGQNVQKMAIFGPK